MLSIDPIRFACPRCRRPLLLTPVLEFSERQENGRVEVNVRFDDTAVREHAAQHTPPSEDTMQTPTVGRIVHYTLTAGDVAAINRLAVRHNPVTEGDVLAAVITKVWSADPDLGTSNLRVILDGEGDYWATSRTITISTQDAAGHWSWPART